MFTCENERVDEALLRQLRTAEAVAETLVELDRAEEAHRELERLQGEPASAGEAARRLALLALGSGVVAVTLALVAEPAFALAFGDTSGGFRRLIQIARSSFAKIRRGPPSAFSRSVGSSCVPSTSMMSRSPSTRFHAVGSLRRYRWVSRPSKP